MGAARTGRNSAKDVGEGSVPLLGRCLTIEPTIVSAWLRGVVSHSGSMNAMPECESVRVSRMAGLRRRLRDSLSSRMRFSDDRCGRGGGGRTVLDGCGSR